MEIRSLSFPPNPVHGQEYDHKGRRFWWNSLVGAWFQTTMPALGPFPLPAREQWIALTADFTLLNQTAAQAAFPTGGILLASNRTYLFDCSIHFAVLSSSSGTYGFAFGGTATLTRQKWSTYGANKVATTTAQDSASSVTHGNVGANTALTSAATAVNGGFLAKGILRVGVGGTLIPQISQSVAFATTVKQDSYFAIRAIGMDTQQSSDT